MSSTKYSTGKNFAARILSCTAVLLCMTAIFLFSCQNADQSSSVSGSFIAKIAFIAYPDFHTMTPVKQDSVIESMQSAVRTAAHASIYCLLGILAAVALITFDNPPLKVFLLAALFCLLYAISDEFHQYFVPGRSMQLQDVLTDLAGSAVGSGAVSLIFRHARKRKA